MLNTKLVTPRAILSLSLLLIAKITWASSAIHIGHTTNLVNDVLGRTEADKDEKKLQLNEQIFFKEQIITKDNSNAVVTFRDGSTFVIAPKSVVLLDEFIFNPSENISKKSITVLKGTLRYISGVSIKNATTEIKTPFGTAGIRGSSDDINVNLATKQLTVIVGSGETKITGVNGQVSQTFSSGQSVQSTFNGVTQPLPAQVGQIAQFFINTLGPPSSSSPALTVAQVKADAKVNNMSVVAQKEAANATKESPKPDLKGSETPPPQKTPIPTNPISTVNQLTQGLKAQNNTQAASSTVIVMEAAIKDNPAIVTLITSALVAGNIALAPTITATAIAASPKDAAAITTAAVTAAPTLAAAITSAAVTAAPASAAAITTAAVTAAPTSAAAITSAAVTAAPASASAITTAAVTAAPTSVAAITSAAVTAAPASAAAITTAAVTAEPASAAAITTAAVTAVPTPVSAAIVTAVVENPSVVNSSAMTVAVAAAAVKADPAAAVAITIAAVAAAPDSAGAIAAAAIAAAPAAAAAIKEAASSAPGVDKSQITIITNIVPPTPVSPS